MDKKSEMTREQKNILLKTIGIRFPFVLLFLALLIFVPAGTFNYWQAYAYFAVIIIPMLFVLCYFMKNDPKFLERRMRTKEKEKSQRLLVLVMTPIFFAGYVVAGFDHRFCWSHVPTAVVIIGDVLVLAGYLVVFLTFRENSFASRIVEIDENQKVISTGVYSIVRHPMYSGSLVMWLATSIALGSYWGCIPFFVVLPATFVLRILNEEKVLSENLPGYKDYCRKTRYRLIPLLW